MDRKTGLLTITCETVPDRLMCEGSLKMGIPLKLVGPTGMPDGEFVKDEVPPPAPSQLAQIPAPAKKRRRKKKEGKVTVPAVEDIKKDEETSAPKELEKPPEMTVFEQVVDLATQLMNTAGDDKEEMKNQIFIELQVAGAMNTSALKKLPETDHQTVLNGLKKLKANKESFDK